MTHAPKGQILAESMISASVADHKENSDKKGAIYGPQIIVKLSTIDVQITISN